MIRVHLTNPELHAGETLRGQVVWNKEGGKSPRKVDVKVRWVMSGKGDWRETVIEEFSEPGSETQSQIVVPMNVEIPFGPVTYEGKLFKIQWEVFVNADLPFAIDEKQTVPFIVRPAVWTSEQFQAFLRVDDDEDDDDDSDIDDDDDDDDDDVDDETGNR